MYSFLKYCFCSVVLCLALNCPGFAQRGGRHSDEDRFHIIIGADVCILPMQLTGVTEVGENGFTGDGIPIKPRYAVVTSNFLMTSGTVQAGVSYPFIKWPNNWSLGVKGAAGIGTMSSFSEGKGAGLEGGLIFDFPVYAYARKTIGKVELAGLVGFKYAHYALPYSFPLAAVEFKFGGDKSICLHTSLRRYKYYSYYTNGEEAPFLKIGEIGITMIKTFL